MPGRAAEWAALRQRLLGDINPAEDSLRFYLLDEIAAGNVEHHGVEKPLDLREPPICDAVREPQAPEKYLKIHALCKSLRIRWMESSLTI